MPKPLIILGAGASLDYVDEEKSTRPLKYQPPVSNGLLDSRFERQTNSFKELKGLSAFIARKLTKEMSLELIMESLQKDAVTKVARQKQLNALIFYLQKLFIEISENYGHQSFNNYNALIDKIVDYGGEACVVTFNYDLLFEQGLESFSLIDNKIDSYISGQLKYIKLHGSCDWFYNVDSSFAIEEDFGDTYDLFVKEPYYLTQYPNMSSPTLYRQRHRGGYYIDEGKNRRYLLPAIAIPVANKEHNFICPESHIKAMTNVMQETDRILVIGWRAQDKQIMDTMAPLIKRGVKLVVVSETKQGADAIVERFKRVITPGDIVSIGGGFSKFIKSPDFENFFIWL